MIRFKDYDDELEYQSGFDVVEYRLQVSKALWWGQMKRWNSDWFSEQEERLCWGLAEMLLEEMKK